MLYKIISGQNLIEFIAVVQEQLNKGWVCQGGIFVIPTNQYTQKTYYQTLVK